MNNLHKSGLKNYDFNQKLAALSLGRRPKKKAGSLEAASRSAAARRLGRNPPKKKETDKLEAAGRMA